jgi:hypothetical protein
VLLNVLDRCPEPVTLLRHLKELLVPGTVGYPLVSNPPLVRK